MRYVDMPQDERALEFPTAFPVKAMGKPSDDIKAVLLKCLDDLGVTYNPKAVQAANSSSGKFVSITATITAENREQLDAIYETLAAHPAILMTL